jgi:hypothetical protein
MHLERVSSTRRCSRAPTPCAMLMKDKPTVRYAIPNRTCGPCCGEMEVRRRCCVSQATIGPRRPWVRTEGSLDCSCWRQLPTRAARSRSGSIQLVLDLRTINFHKDRSQVQDPATVAVEWRDVPRGMRPRVRCQMESLESHSLSIR